MSETAREQFAGFVPDGDLKRLAAELPDRLATESARYNRPAAGICDIVESIFEATRPILI